MNGVDVTGRDASTIGVAASAFSSVGSGALLSKIASLSCLGWVSSTASPSLAATLVTIASG